MYTIIHTITKDYSFVKKKYVFFRTLFPRLHPRPLDMVACRELIALDGEHHGENGHEEERPAKRFHFQEIFPGKSADHEKKDQVHQVKSPHRLKRHKSIKGRGAQSKGQGGENRGRRRESGRPPG